MSATILRLDPVRISRPTLLDEIVTRLRDLVIEGVLQPGERINESRLCERLGVSRTPLREALRFLASEGLIELVPNRGGVVRRFSPTGIRDMLVVIGALEALAGRLACKAASDIGIGAIRDLHDAMLRCFRSGERLPYFKLNQTIHTAIVALSENEALRTSHERLQSQVKRLRFLGHEGPANWSEAVAEHETMMRALQARDGEALALALSDHMEGAWRRVEASGLLLEP